MGIKDGLELVYDKIDESCLRAKRSSEEVQLIAVSKKKPVSMIVEAFHFGQVNFGENYVQEAVEKIDKCNLGERASWHFIGHLQKNKVKFIKDKFDYIHSVDSLGLIQELENRSEYEQKILLQINLVNEASKSGVAVESVPSFLESMQEISSKVTLAGLMFMPPFVTNAEENRSLFARVYELSVDWKKYLGDRHNLSELSMGTSQDYHVAIEEGATFVRVGSNIFGSRD